MTPDVDEFRPASSAPTSSTSAPAILMVDDQPARLLTCEAVLSGLDVCCVRALSGREALEKLHDTEFAVVLLDVNMPGMDGFEVARRMRAQARFAHIPIIFVTGVNDTPLDQLRGYEVGAIDYITIPIVSEVLRSKVAILVELYRRRAELQLLNRQLTHARDALAADHARTREQLEAIFEHPSEAIVVMQAVRDASGHVSDWLYREANSNALKVVGHSRESLMGRSALDVPSRERGPAVCARLTRVLETGVKDRYEVQHGDTHFFVTMFPMGGDCVVSAGVDITERKLMEAALRESDQALRESQQRLQLADRRKDEFLAMLAHELRNPLAPIRSAAEALGHMHSDDAGTSRLASIVQRQTQTLSRLLDDLLDVARITQGRIQIQRELVPLQACIDLALETVAHLIGERHHDLVVERPGEPLYANADRVRLGQCLGNLLANAAKYTEPGGKIRIRSYAHDGEAVIEVSDNGQGIAPEFLPQMFDLFAQSERALDRAQGGLGVGLCVCRELMLMQGGSVTGTSLGPGQGSTFSLRLPLAQPPSASAHAVTVYRSIHRILIVDDNHDAADALATLLQMDGHEVQTVYEAEAGLARLTSFAPDIALLDIGLPRMNGYELAVSMRQRNIPNLKLIAVSGYGQPDDRARSKAAGFDVHLLKPVEIAELREVLSAQVPGHVDDDERAMPVLQQLQA